MLVELVIHNPLAIAVFLPQLLLCARAGTFEYSADSFVWYFLSLKMIFNKSLRLQHVDIISARPWLCSGAKYSSVVSAARPLRDVSQSPCRAHHQWRTGVHACDCTGNKELDSFEWLIMFERGVRVTAIEIDKVSLHHVTLIDLASAKCLSVFG